MQAIAISGSMLLLEAFLEHRYETFVELKRKGSLKPYALIHVDIQGPSAYF